MAFVFLLSVFFLPPRMYQTRQNVFVISNGETVRAISNRLAKDRFIESPILFEISIKIWGGKVMAGSYHFPERQSVFMMAKDIASGDRHAKVLRITIKDGSTNTEIAKIVKEKYPNFDANAFLTLARKYQGYLYPDTYFFNEDEMIKPDILISLMRETFSIRTKNLLNKPTYLNRYTLDEIVTIASIVDREGASFVDKRKIAGVIYNRLKQGIPLQVDVCFEGKHTYSLSQKDLSSDDPYNTYKNKGLPPAPCGNPNVDSILASLRPIESEYVYFVGDGKHTYFSKTLQEHAIKRSQYVDNRTRKN
ncbi:MAG: endolytic transglycosylase MltG [Alphaproteobacteria bacterium]|nr:endolytic transglycosylase MltG [Alphaproteobacteria bacterium]